MNKILLISITVLLFLGISCASAINLDMDNGKNVVANGDNVLIKEGTDISKQELQKLFASNSGLSKGICFNSLMGNPSSTGFTKIDRIQYEDANTVHKKGNAIYEQYETYEHMSISSSEPMDKRSTVVVKISESGSDKEQPIEVYKISKKDRYNDQVPGPIERINIEDFLSQNDTMGPLSEFGNDGSEALQ